MKWFQSIQEFDLCLFHWCMARRRREMLTALGRSISKTADGWIYILFIFAYGFFNWPNSTPFLMCFLAGFLAERSIYYIMKNSCKRNRPADAIVGFSSFIVPSDRFSFPSGHTSAAFLFTVFVASQYPVLLPFLLVWAVLVAMSRVFLGVHFPTDTVVGAILGSSVSFVALHLGGLI